MIDIGNKEKMHGDDILEFISRASDASVAYYDASDNNGIVSTKSLIDGLNWMKDNNIYYINISLSGSRYSDEMQKWIEDNEKR